MNANDLLLTSAQSYQQFTCCLWDYKNLNVHKHYKNGGTTAPNCLEILGQDYILTSELGKPLLHLWLLNSQDVTKNVRLVLPEPANCLAVCPRNTYLVVGINCKIYVWHMSSGKLLSIQQKHYQPVTVIKFSSDGNFLLVAGQDGMLVNYCLSELLASSQNFLSQTDIGKVEPVYVKKDHSMAIRGIHVGIFGAKSRFATVSTDRTCRIYNLLKGELLCNLVFEDCLTSVIFDSWFGRLYVGTEIGKIRQFNLKEPPNTLTHHIDESSNLEFIGHTGRVACLALNKSETILASGSLDCFVLTWDVKKLQLLNRIKHSSPITNIKFVVNYANFFAENIKPNITIKALERSLELATDWMVSNQQTKKIEIDYTGNLWNEQSREELLKENSQLKDVNKELYDTLLLLSKKSSK